MADTNLAQVASFGLTFGSEPQICFLDMAVYSKNAPSIRIQPTTTGNRESDGQWYTVKPGDHIVARALIKVDALAGFVFNPNDYRTWRGARILIDLYGHGHWLDSFPHDGAEDVGSVVPWGTAGWVLKTWDFTVPSTVYQIPVPYDPHPTGYSGPAQVDSIVMVLNVSGHGSAADQANAWFSDPELYINPSTMPSTYRVTILQSTNGTTNPPSGAYDLDAGTDFAVKAIPNDGYKFSKWLFDTVDQTPWWPTDLFNAWSIAADHTLQALFEAVSHPPPPSQAGGTPAFLLVIGGVTVFGLALGLTSGRKRIQRRRRR